MSVLDLFKLDGKVAVVTGGGKGIGRGIVLEVKRVGTTCDDAAAVIHISGRVVVVGGWIRAALDS